MKFIALVLILFLLSCSQSVDSITNDERVDTSKKWEPKLPTTNRRFQWFLAEIPEVTLPIKIKGCEVDYTEFPLFNEENPSPYIDGYAYVVGQFETNGEYVAVITLGAADCMLPIITTYNSHGETIDRKTIAIGYCGSGPCFECEEFMTLKEDFSLYTADTLTTTDCDDDYHPIPGTERIEVIYQEGRLTSTGRIELSEEMNKEL